MRKSNLARSLSTTPEVAFAGGGRSHLQGIFPAGSLGPAL